MLWRAHPLLDGTDEQAALSCPLDGNTLLRDRGGKVQRSKYKSSRVQEATDGDLCNAVYTTQLRPHSSPRPQAPPTGNLDVRWERAWYVTSRECTER